MKTMMVVLTCLMLGGCASRVCQGTWIDEKRQVVRQHESQFPRSGMTAGGQLYYNSGDVTTIWKPDGSVDYIYH